MSFIPSKNRILQQGIVHLIPLLLLAAAIITIPIVIQNVQRSQEIQESAAQEKVGGCGNPNSCRDWEVFVNGCCHAIEGSGCSQTSDCVPGTSCINGVCGGGGTQQRSQEIQESAAQEKVGGCGNPKSCRDWEVFVNGCCHAIEGSGCSQDSDCVPGTSCVNGVCGGGSSQQCGGPTWQCTNRNEVRCINGKEYQCGNDLCFHKINDACPGQEVLPTPTTPPAQPQPTSKPKASTVGQVYCGDGTKAGECSTKVKGLMCSYVAGETRAFLVGNSACGQRPRCTDGTLLTECSKSNIGKRCLLENYSPKLVDNLGCQPVSTPTTYLPIIKKSVTPSPKIAQNQPQCGGHGEQCCAGDICTVAGEDCLGGFCYPASSALPPRPEKTESTETETPAPDEIADSGQKPYLPLIVQESKPTPSKVFVPSVEIETPVVAIPDEPVYLPTIISEPEPPADEPRGVAKIIGSIFEFFSQLRPIFLLTP